jgi:hypothetical protein
MYGITSRSTLLNIQVPSQQNYDAYEIVSIYNIMAWPNNVSSTSSFARQWHRKRTLIWTKERAISRQWINAQQWGVLLEAVCCLRSNLRQYKEDQRKKHGFLPLMEADSNTTTVAMRVAGGDEGWTQCLGGITVSPCSWGIREPGVAGWGSLESETVKYCDESRWTRTRNWRLVRTSSNYKRQTRPHVREGAPHQQIRNCLRVIKILSWVPCGYLAIRWTGRMTVSSNISLTLKRASRGDWSQEWLLWRRPAAN